VTFQTANQSASCHNFESNAFSNFNRWKNNNEYVNFTISSEQTRIILCKNFVFAGQLAKQPCPYKLSLLVSNYFKQFFSNKNQQFVLLQRKRCYDTSANAFF
jgi:hypothetical protein